MSKYVYPIILLCLVPLAWAEEESEFKFALPEFDTEYTMPESQHAPARAAVWAYVDLGVLIAALLLAAWLILKVRARPAVYGLMVFSLLYFGFWKEGCICPVGSLQNIVAALADPAYGLPAVLAAVFFLPLIFTLFFGRVFCAAVCPLGAVQDIVALKPLKIPGRLEHILGLFPYLYLGLTVLFAALGAGFIICRHDPYVTLFRLSGGLTALTLSVLFLGLGVIIARPYCRYLCPYGALLRVVSRFTKWHAAITPDECVQCRLCEDSCPFGAIRAPSAERELEPRRKGMQRIGLILVLLPLFLGLGAGAGYLLHVPFSKAHRTVALAERVTAENSGQVEGTTLESDAWRGAGESPADLHARAQLIRARFRIGSLLFGLFAGLILWGKLLALSTERMRTDYEPDRMKCVSCARCFSFCPKEKLRRKKLKQSPQVDKLTSSQDTDTEVTSE
ncbi:4Fe-4S binding protein [Planctomycetota bacterium]